MQPKIIKVTEISKDDFTVTVTRVGGVSDGETFEQVDCLISDGRELRLYRSNARKGYFKSVFVPWDFEHPKMA